MLYTFTLWPAHGQGGSICASKRPQGTPRHPGGGAPSLPLDLKPGTHPQPVDWLQLVLYGPGGSWHQASWSQGQGPLHCACSGAPPAQPGIPRPRVLCPLLLVPDTSTKKGVWEEKQRGTSPLWGGAEAPGEGVFLGSIAARLLHEGRGSVNQLQGPSLAPPTTCCSTGPWLPICPTGAHTGWLGQGRGSRSIWKLIHPFAAGSTANITH